MQKPVQISGVTLTDGDLKVIFTAERYERLWPWQKPWKLKVQIVVPGYTIWEHYKPRYSDADVNRIMGRLENSAR